MRQKEVKQVWDDGDRASTSAFWPRALPPSSLPSITCRSTFVVGHLLLQHTATTCLTTTFVLVSEPTTNSPATIHRKCPLQSSIAISSSLHPSVVTSFVISICFKCSTSVQHTYKHIHTSDRRSSATRTHNGAHTLPMTSLACPLVSEY